MSDQLPTGADPTDSETKYPLISICVSTYNRKDYLELCLKSLLDQTWPNCQIVVVDDGSNDGTAEMMREKFPLVKYFRQENAGDSAAKKHAAEESEGQYIVFNDSDDLFMPDAVERLYDALPKDDPQAISYGNYLTIDAEGSILQTKHKAEIYPSGNITGDLLKHVLVNYCATLFPRQVYLDYSRRAEPVRVAYDYRMYLNLSLDHRFYAVQEPVFYRRRHGNNLSAAGYEKLTTIFRVFSDFVEEHPELREKYGTIIRRRLADFHNKLYREARREHRTIEALMHLKESLRSHFSFKALFRLPGAFIRSARTKRK